MVLFREWISRSWSDVRRWCWRFASAEGFWTLNSTFRGAVSSGTPAFLSHVGDASPLGGDGLTTTATSPLSGPGGGDVSKWRRLVGDPPGSSRSGLLNVYEHVRFLLVHVLHGLKPLHYRHAPSVQRSAATRPWPGRL